MLAIQLHSSKKKFATRILLYNCPFLCTHFIKFLLYYNFYIPNYTVQDAADGAMYQYNLILFASFVILFLLDWTSQLSQIVTELEILSSFSVCGGDSRMVIGMLRQFLVYWFWGINNLPTRFVEKEVLLVMRFLLIAGVCFTHFSLSTFF